MAYMKMDTPAALYSELASSGSGFPLSFAHGQADPKS